MAGQDVARGGTTAAITTGLVIGAIEVVIALSFSALVFAGPLREHLATGSGLAMASAAVMMFVVGARTGRPGTSASLQDVPAVFLSAIAAGIAANTHEEARLATVVASMAVAAAATGAVFSVAGRVGVGRFVRYLPYPVVGGFLAGTGLVLVRGGLEVGAPPVDGWLVGLADPPTAARWGLTMLTMAVVTIALRRTTSVAVLPLSLLAVLTAFHVVRLGLGVDRAQAAAAGWVPETMASGFLWRPLGGASLGDVDIGALWAAAPTLLVLIVFSAVALLLQVSGVEVLVRRDLDLDHELRVAGSANLAAAFVGGFPGYHALTFNQLTERTGARSRVTFAIATVAPVAVLAGGARLLGWLPTFLLGGLLLMLGIDFVLDWLVAVRHRVSRPEHLTIVGIAIVIAVWGFLPGVLVGTVAAFVLFVGASSSVDPVRVETDLAHRPSAVDRPGLARDHLREVGREVWVLSLHGYLFFGTAAQVVARCGARLAEGPVRAVVLDLAGVTGLDSSAVQSFVRLQQQLSARGARLVLAGLDPRSVDRLRNGGVSVDDGAVEVWPDLDAALGAVEEALLADAGFVALERVELVGTLRRLFGGDVDLARLAGYFEQVELASGDELVSAGGRSGALHIIEAGSLDVRLAGGGVRVRRLGPGSVLGEVAFLTEGRHTADVVAVTPVAAHTLTLVAWERMRARNVRLAAAVERGLGRVVAARLGDTLDTVERLGAERQVAPAT